MNDSGRYKDTQKEVNKTENNDVVKLQSDDHELTLLYLKLSETKQNIDHIVLFS